jgi:hypothetical protein
MSNKLRPLKVGKTSSLGEDRKMKKLANLSAVAVLAAFGWVGVAYADDFGDPLPDCSVTDAASGFASDFLDVSWSDVGAAAYSVAVVCMDPNTGRSKSAKIEVGDVTAASVYLTEFNGWRSLKEDDVCMVAVKGLHTDKTPNNSVIGKTDCDGMLAD